MRKSQQEFKIKGFEKTKDAFGGSLLKGNPKKKRPLDSKLPIHLTLRAQKSVLRRPDFYGKVEKVIKDASKKHGVKIYKSANVGNHLHLALKIRHVNDWAGFIRELTGRIALACQGKKGFWMFRPHTRIVQGWKNALRTVLDYIYLNQLEAEGQILRKETKTLKDLREMLGTG